MVAMFLLMMAGTIVALAVADTLVDSPPAVLLMALLALLYVTIGLFTAASYALLMDVTHPRLAATQFSAFMGATNLCESWSALAVGRLAGSFGYAPAFVVMALASLLALPMLPGLRRPLKAG
jgi:MFS transporter, PAT family, beta-lactamase induction signal transducer AmpG